MPYLGNSLSVGSSAVTASASALASFTNTYSVDFDGVDDYINADALDLNSEIGTGDVSIAFWVKFDDLTGDNYIFYFGKDSGNFDYIFSRYANSSSKIELVFREGGGGGTFTLDWDTTPSIDTWYHVGFSRTGSTAKLYIDGAMVDSGTNAEIASPLGAVGDTTTTIGAFRTGIVPLNGHLDEFTIWNSILTDAEFAEIAAEPIDLSANFGDYVSSANVLANWRCEDGSGTNLEDSSGNGYDATLTNGPIWSTDVPGVIPFTNTYSVDFDNSDDYIDLTAFNPSTQIGSGDITISVWVKLDSIAGYDTVASLTYYNASAEKSIKIQFLPGLGFRVQFANSGAFTNIYSTATIAANTWYHVIATRTGTTGNIWVNNANNGTTTHSNVGTDLSGATWHALGLYHAAATPDMGGLIHDYAIFDRVISSDERAELYNNGVSIDAREVTGADPVAYYPLNEGTSTVATDLISANNGTLTNGPTWSTDVPT